MTLLSWLAAGCVIAYGLITSVFAAADVWLVATGRTSISDLLRAAAESRPWLPVVFTAVLVGLVSLMLGALIGHLWLQ